MNITNASTRFATLGILGFFEFTVLSGKFELNLHGSKRVMQALHELKIAVFLAQFCDRTVRFLDVEVGRFSFFFVAF
ncbi:cupin domain-containing protein [Aliivibrio fischeri]|uniref:hypothetical protein n=1 Tax=Aliivibrio fischeri TaxID=668 RepID=UPI0006CFA545|nr:hypothetical protein [Aliivibrio fischeri]USR97154.1 hypothetical protein AVFI_18400 [Aliivibrio fischeri ATCC 7744 = JCM 18803 = DSM 507]GGK50567.1 hypothetical protein GCM10007987_37060 [Aliivibrio fischeri]